MNKIPSWVWLALLAGGGYLAYRFLKKQLQVVTAPLSAGIAAPIIAAQNFFHQGPQTGGAIVLPNGSLVPTSAIRAYIDNSTGQTRAQYQGHTYVLAPHNADGNWPATLMA